MVINVRGTQWLRDKNLFSPWMGRFMDGSTMGDETLWAPNTPQQASLWCQRNTRTPTVLWEWDFKTLSFLGRQRCLLVLPARECLRPLEWPCGVWIEGLCSHGRGCPTLKALACRSGDPADTERQSPYTLPTSTISTWGSQFFGFSSPDAGTQAQMSQFRSRYSWGPRRPPTGLQGTSPPSQ